MTDDRPLTRPQPMTSEFPSLKAIAAHLGDRTGQKVTVSRTERYLSAYYVKDGSIATARVEIPGGALYCLKGDDLAPVIAEIRGETTP